MKARDRERQAARESFQKMNLKEKAAYIFTYYKFPLFTACVVILFLISLGWQQITRKEPVLYVAYVNFTAGEDLDQKLTDGYLSYSEMNPNKQEMIVYRDLYITEDASVEDHQFVYASKMKLIGSIDASKLDVVIMDEDAWKQMSQSGFLHAFSDLQDKKPEIVERLQPYMRENEVILEDNAVQYQLNEAEEYHAVTEMQMNAIDVSEFPLFQKAGMSGSVYAGIIANTKRPRQSLSYLDYLRQAE